MKTFLFALALSASAATLVVPALAAEAGQTPPASGRQADDAGAPPMENGISGGGMMGRMMSMMGGSSNRMGHMPANTMMGGSPAGTGGPQSQPHSDK